MIETKEDIIQELDKRYDRLCAWVKAQEAERFIQGPEGKWTTGQHIGHLIKSTQPLNMAMRLPRIQLRTMFGKPNRETRSYDAVVKRYLERLAQAVGGASPKEFIPKVPSIDEKSNMIDTLNKEREKLKTIIAKWDEEKLDKYLLPHPLMGKMVLREILFFTLYHTEHHTRALEEKY